MNDAECRQEIKDLIAWYEARGKNWLSAAEFTLARHSGRSDFVPRPIPWSRRKKEGR